MSNKIDKFFVYGSLRPDIKAPWSKYVYENSKFNIKSYFSCLPYSKLFFNKNIKFAVTIYDKELYTYEDKTMGYILESDNVDETLSVFDYIEEYPQMYDRIIVKCYNEEKHEIEDAYFYTMNKCQYKNEDLVDIGVNDFKKFSSECNENYSVPNDNLTTK